MGPGDLGFRPMPPVVEPLPLSFSQGTQEPPLTPRQGVWDPLEGTPLGVPNTRRCQLLGALWRGQGNVGGNGADNSSLGKSWPGSALPQPIEP